MAGVEPKDSRNRDDKIRIARQATDFVWTVRMQGIDAAAVTSIPMSRRHLLDIALELAARHINAARAMEVELASTARSAQHRARIAHEEATWTDSQATAAHERYRHGERNTHVREGHRVYIRRQRRARNQRALEIRFGQDEQGDVA